MKNLRDDLKASIVVFLVALPLCIGIALASGAPLISGLISGIVGGIVVSIFSGSALGVSGPGAGLALIVLMSIQQLNSFETFLLSVFIAGVIQLIMGSLKIGVIQHYFPSSVIKGMLAGIGLVIMLKQIPHLFGYSIEPEGNTSFVQENGHNTFSDLYYMISNLSIGPIIISIISIIILASWSSLKINKSLLKALPPQLIVVVLTTMFAHFFSTNEIFQLSENQRVNINIDGSLANIFSSLHFPNFNEWLNKDVYIIAITLAIIASLETLLCLEATDQLDSRKRISCPNKELHAQGIGNIVSSLLGGLPITQVIVRSSANIQSGGKTKISAFTHGVLLLFFTIFFSKYLNLIPIASLASILLIVGFKLTHPSIYFKLYKQGLSQFLPFIATVIGILLTDLLIGIIIGLSFATLHIVVINYLTPYEYKILHLKNEKLCTITLSQYVSFYNKIRIINLIKSLPKNTVVTIDASNSTFIHPDVLSSIDSYQNNNRNISIKLLNNTNQINKPKEELFVKN